VQARNPVHAIPPLQENVPRQCDHGQLVYVLFVLLSHCSTPRNTVPRKSRSSGSAGYHQFLVSGIQHMWKDCPKTLRLVERAKAAAAAGYPGIFLLTVDLVRFGYSTGKRTYSRNGFDALPPPLINWCITMMSLTKRTHTTATTRSCCPF
jgi:hypothetical protein